MISWQSDVLFYTCCTTVTVPGAMATMEVTASWVSELYSVICWILTADKETHLSLFMCKVHMQRHINNKHEPKKQSSTSPVYLWAIIINFFLNVSVGLSKSAIHCVFISVAVVTIVLQVCYSCVCQQLLSIVHRNTVGFHCLPQLDIYTHGMRLYHPENTGSDI